MRHVKIYKIFLIQYLKTLMEYKTDFLIGMLSFFIVQSSNIIFLYLIFQRIPSLNGWSYHQVLFVYGFSMIPRGLDHLVTDNLWMLANVKVRSGEFDKYLLRPINPLFHLLAEKFQPDAFGEVLIGGVIFRYSYLKLGLAFTGIQWLQFAVAVIAGIVIYTSIKLAGASIALWTKKSQHFLFIVYQLSDFASYPLSIFSGFIKFILTFVFPFAFVAFIPAANLLEKNVVGYSIYSGVIAAVILWLISYQLIWKSGLKAYESTGS